LGHVRTGVAVSDGSYPARLGKYQFVDDTPQGNPTILNCARNITTQRRRLSDSQRAAKYAPRNGQSHTLKGQVCQLVQADIRTFEPSHEHLLQALNYDAIITDPPYGREHLKLYSELSKFAAR